MQLSGPLIQVWLLHLLLKWDWKDLRFKQMMESFHKQNGLLFHDSKQMLTMGLLLSQKMDFMSFVMASLHKMYI
jgi:hypothetical protein